MSESGLGVVSVAKRSAQALDEGTISQETYAKLQQRLAQEMFPNDTMGVALSKFFASPAGSEMLNRGLKKSYVDLQKRTALANADVLKAAKPAINTRADTSETAVDDDSDSDREEPWDKRVKALMDKHGIGQLQAESILHRAEKVRKNQSW